ncbi:thioredoxin family protein [Actinopolymorpha sp. B9G3]|uniref:TlpA family protein disulfide reductase n=1 Tax=Actinopolymorpha sp. B9G3 TaxID=3158970 RepID=UPI0032D96186
MTTGLAVLVVALTVATVLGVAKRRYDGRFRDAGPSPRADVGAPAPPAAGVVEVLTAADLAGELGERATLVQFSSAFCAPCRATRALLRDVAGKEEGVAYVEVDAESQLDLVRRLRIMRTPTVFVLDADGKVIVRASGQPRRPDVLAALLRATGQRVT